MRLVTVWLSTAIVLASGSAVVASSADMRCVQQQLSFLGYEAGTADGLIGRKTRAAAAEYAASKGAASGLSDLTHDTARQWCTALSKANPELAAFAAERSRDLLVVDDSVSGKTQAVLNRGLDLARDLLKRRVGVVLPEQVRAFAGTDAGWLAENYLQARNLPEGFRAGKQKEFGTCDPPAEGGHYAMFLCLDDQAWRRGESEAMGIVAHEYTHNMQFALVGESGKNCCSDSDAMSVFGPQWLVEGSAEFMKFLLWDELGYRSLDREIREYAGRLRGREIRLSAIETRKGMREHAVGWDVGPVATHYLLAKSGVPALATFWRGIGNGVPMRDAFASAFGRTTEEFEREFAALTK